MTVAFVAGLAVDRWALGDGPAGKHGGAATSPATTSQPPPSTVVVTAVPSATSDGADHTAEPAGSLPGAPSRVNQFGIPVGYPHTEAGAISACGNYVSAYSDVRNREPDRLRAVLRSISTDAASKTIGDQIIRVDRANVTTLGGNSISDPSLDFNLRIIGFSKKSVATDQATVSIWSVGGLGMYGSTGAATTPREVWGSDDCTVVWNGGDWKLSAATDGPDGPVITERPSEAFLRFSYIGGSSE
jgi:hypothetical protein